LQGNGIDKKVEIGSNRKKMKRILLLESQENVLFDQMYIIKYN